MAAVTVLAVVLAAALAFLYYKTDIGEFRKQVQTASHLRELKDIDTRWEAELLRFRSETGTAPAASAHLADTLRRALQGLEAEASASRMVAYSLPELKRAFTDKTELMDKYRAVAATARERLETTLVTAPDINKAVRQALGAILVVVALDAGDVHVADDIEAFLGIGIVADDIPKAGVMGALLLLDILQNDLEGI